MKIICAVLLAVIFSFELNAQSPSAYSLKLNNKKPKMEELSNISLGFGFAEAIRYTPDEHNRDHDFRFLVNLNLTTKIYRPLYLSLGFEYSKKDLDGHFDSFNFSALPSLGGTVFNKKITYFTEIGPNVVAIYYPEDRMIQFSFGLTIGFKTQYNLTNKYSVGVSIKHINYFNVWSEHYFIIHSNIYLSMKI